MWVVEDLPPQETMATAVAASTTRLAKVLFNPETLKRMKDKGLDARKGDYSRAAARSGHRLQYSEVDLL